jgi:hypothetical protein
MHNDLSQSSLIQATELAETHQTRSEPLVELDSAGATATFSSTVEQEAWKKYYSGYLSSI